VPRPLVLGTAIRSVAQAGGPMEARMSIDVSGLIPAVSIVGSLAAAAVVFRVKRELDMQKKGEITWLPWCDVLLLSAVTLILLVVVVPVTTGLVAHLPVRAVAVAAAAAATVLAAAYPYALLAHYRLLLGRGRTDPRTNPEPGERLFVWLGVALATATFIFALACRLYAPDK